LRNGNTAIGAVRQALALPGNPDLLVIPVHGNSDLKVGLQRRLMKLAGLTDNDR